MRSLYKLCSGFFKLSEPQGYELLDILPSFLGRKISEDDLDYWSKMNQLSDDEIYSSWRLSDDGYIYIDSDEYINNDHIMVNSLRIYKRSRYFKDMYINKERFLKGYKDIPNLYFYDLDYKINNYEVPSQNYYLINAILDLISNYDSDVPIDDVINFIEGHREKFDEIRALTNNSNPKKLGSGAAGIAIEINPGMVLKLFRDKFSYEKAIESINRLHKDPDLGKTEAMIYDAGYLGEISNTSIYYSIIEKMTIIDDIPRIFEDILRRLIKDIIQYILNVSYFRGEILEFKKTKNIDKDILNVLIKHTKSRIEGQFDIAEITEKLNLNINWLDRLIEEIAIKYITDRGDLHLGNIGITSSGYLRYFDPSHKAYKDYINYTR